jgi:hypothetical protein
VTLGSYCSRVVLGGCREASVVGAGSCEFAAEVSTRATPACRF